MTVDPTQQNEPTGAPDAPAAAPAAPAAEPRPAETTGWAEWLWQGQALRAARAAGRPELREARSLVEQGDRLLEPVPALRHGSGAGTALSLYEKAHALAASTDPTPTTAEPVGDLDVETKAAVVRERALAAIDRLDPLPKIELGLLTKRITRIGAVLALLVAVSVGAGVAVRSATRGPNLAAGKAWTTSSKYGGYAPEAHLVDGNKSGVFFHTNEEQDPWVQFDLGGPVSVARVVVKNRSECCTERVIPLVIAVSNDGARWDEVAQRHDPFSTWDAVFASRTARFVRLTTKKRTWLHLEQVTIHGK